MSFDTLGREAGARLWAAAASTDTDAALQRLLEADRARPPWRQRWVGWAACAAVAILALWLVSPHLPTRADDPAPPAQNTRAQRVGTQLTVPASFEVPDDWRSSYDGGFVVLHPDSDPSSTALYVGTPTKLYRPGVSGSQPWSGSLLEWAQHQPYLDAVNPRSVVAGQQQGTVVDLRPKRGEGWRFHIQLPFVELTDDTATETIGYAKSYRTFTWAVLPVDGQELLLVLVSPREDDVELDHALTEVLDSLRLGAAADQ
jgi:hypothetical protein